MIKKQKVTINFRMAVTLVNSSLKNNKTMTKTENNQFRMWAINQSHKVN